MYNTASFLPRCLDTLLDQDIPADSYEIILVDDGSTDNSLELAQEYAAKSTSDATMTTICVEHHANKGLAGARNTGLKAATGKYLCFVDPDDYIEKQSLSALLRQMEEEQLDVLRFNYQKVDEDGNYLPDSEMEGSFDYSSKIMSGVEFMQDRLTTSCYVWAYIYRRELILENSIYFDESCYFDDVPWLPRVLPLAQRVNCVSTRHLLYTQRTGSMVNTKNLEAIKRKVDGLLKVLDLLSKHNIDKNIKGWYSRMYTHIVTSVLTSVAIHLYNMRYDYIDQIKKYNVYPLSKQKMTTKNIRKINLINISPRLFMWLVNKKNK
jgi:glycosyltransferase involved in cell wall biosynthesis